MDVSVAIVARDLLAMTRSAATAQAGNPNELDMNDELGRTENLGLRTLRKTGEKRERFPSMKG